MSETGTDKTLKFITHPLGAALSLTLFLVIIYIVSVSVCKVPNVIRFFLLAFAASAVFFYINNHYLLNNFKNEPKFNGTFDEYLKISDKTGKPSTDNE